MGLKDLGQARWVDGSPQEGLNFRPAATSAVNSFHPHGQSDPTGSPGFTAGISTPGGTSISTTTISC
jgi:hypothetical protein